MKNKELKGLIKDMKLFLDGKNPKELHVYKFDKEGKPIEVINEFDSCLDIE